MSHTLMNVRVMVILDLTDSIGRVRAKSGILGAILSHHPDKNKNVRVKLDGSSISINDIPFANLKIL